MTQNESRIFLLGQENVKTALLKLGIPGMVTMLVSVFYNLVDAFFVGQL
jgi:Na+-driven multidrug efflux pump